MRSRASLAHLDPGEDASLLALPVSSGARILRILALLVVDAALLAAGVVFILSYLDARALAAADPAVAPQPGNGARAGFVHATSDQVSPDQVRRTEIATAVDEHRAEIQKCYSIASRALGNATVPEGRLDIALTVEPDGRVSQADTVVNETDSKSLSDCVSSFFSSLHFPARADASPVQLVWPLRFQAPR